MDGLKSKRAAITGSYCERNLYMFLSLRAYCRRKATALSTPPKRLKLLHEVREQALWLARTHINPEVRRKHKTIAETCRIRILELGGAA